MSDSGARALYGWSLRLDDTRVFFVCLFKFLKFVLLSRFLIVLETPFIEMYISFGGVWTGVSCEWQTDSHVHTAPVCCAGDVDASVSLAVEAASGTFST